MRWAVMAAGLVLQVVGELWDPRWHATHPAQLERGADLLAAHGIVYAGMLVLLVGAALGVLATDARPSWPVLAVLAGSLAEASGALLDGWRHTQGSESSLGHLLLYAGLLVAIIGLVAASRSHGGGRRTSSATVHRERRST